MRFVLLFAISFPMVLLGNEAISRCATLVTQCAFYMKIRERESISFRYLRSHAPIEGVIDPWAFMEMHSHKAEVKLPSFAQLSSASRQLYEDEAMQTFERSLQSLGEEVVALEGNPEMETITALYKRASQFRFDFRSIQDIQINFRILNEIEEFVETSFDKGTRYFEKENLEVLRNELRRLLPAEIFNTEKCQLSYRAVYLAQIAGKERRGTFGYHATTNAHAVFQEVVRAVVESVTERILPEEFYFLRIPGLRQYDGMSTQAFLRGRSSIHDLWGNDQDLLVSLNPCLFSNHGEKTESTMSRVFMNESVSKGDRIAEGLIRNFMLMVGLDESVGNELVKIAQKLPSKNGTLLQFDVSSPHKKKLREFCYASRRHGVPEAGRSVERVLDQPRQSDQLRLVMSNHGSLNPFGPLRIRAYRDVDPDALKATREALKACLRKAKMDPKKKEAYRNKLLTDWSS